MRRVIQRGVLVILAALTAMMSANLATAQSEQITEIETFTTFADWCINKARLTPESRHTVEVLLEEAQTQNCHQAQEVLTNLTELYLRDSQIVEVAPLASLFKQPNGA